MEKPDFDSVTCPRLQEQALFWGSVDFGLSWWLVLGSAGGVLVFFYLCCTEDKLKDKAFLPELLPVTRVRSESEVQSP